MKEWELLKHYLRRNPAGKKGGAGSLSLRFLLSLDPRMKPRRLEVGLGTSDEEEAIKRARVLLRGFYLLGGQFTGRLVVLGRKGHVRPLADALVETAPKKAAQERHKNGTRAAQDGGDEWGDMPLFTVHVYPHGDGLQDRER